MDAVLGDSKLFSYDGMVERTRPELNGLTPDTCLMWVESDPNGNHSLVVLHCPDEDFPVPGSDVDNNNLFVYLVRADTFTITERFEIARIHDEHS